MIRFGCTCGQYTFELPDEQAGKQVQCPRCHRLNDVPGLDDLAALSEDGTYKVESWYQEQERDRLAQLQRTFRRQRVDDDGREIDLRLKPEDLKNVGADQVPLELRDQVRPGAPKYDPVTGELLRPLDLKDQRVQVDPATVPMARAVIGYALGDTAQAFGGLRIVPELFNFANITVIMAIFFAHIFLQFLTFPIAIGFWMVAPVFLGLVFLLISHYSIVVHDIGTEGNNELPRPLRDLDPRDDLWYPFVQFITAAALSYGWMGFASAIPGRAGIAFAVAMFVVGTILFPAVFLTLTTSGTVLNLRPDRVLGVMVACGTGYVAAVLSWIAASLVYLIGIVTTCMPALHLIRIYPPDLPAPLVYPILLIGIFMMHAFCWYLALQYRAHHADFPWVYQFHERKNAAEMPRRKAVNALPDLTIVGLPTANPIGQNPPANQPRT